MTFCAAQQLFIGQKVEQRFPKAIQSLRYTLHQQTVASATQIAVLLEIKNLYPPNINDSEPMGRGEYIYLSQGASFRSISDLNEKFA
jgi:hypothetical protein